MWKLRALLLTAPAVIFATLVMGIISMLTSLWDRTGFTQHRLARRWSRVLLTAGFVRCRVSGIEKLDPSRGYVFVANHASYFDTPAIISCLPLQFRFYAKHGLFSIPLLGGHLKRAGHLPVIREDPRSSLKTMSEGARIVRDRRVSVLLFPEGGRTPVQMRPFKEGAAYIAIKAGVPIVPIGLVGTRRVLPMGSMMVRGGDIEIVVGDPIETDGLTIRDRGELTQRLQDQVVAMAQETMGPAVNGTAVNA
ncbi:MAG TPA: lysophospholipid acyltransferase family protein [Bryobacteraceae bacterium]